MKSKFILIYNRFNEICIKSKNKFIKKIYKHPDVRSIEESLIKVNKDKCSVSRFGDGELWIICGGSIRYQKSNELLKLRLKEVLKSNLDKHIVTIPDIFTEDRLNLRTDSNREFWNRHLSIHRKDWYNNILKNKTYYNTAISRFYIPIKDKNNSKRYIQLLKNIWDKRDILIIEGSGSRLGVGNDLFENSKSIKRIICPSENAFDKYDEILNKAKKYCANKLVLLALGPTATVLAYDLSMLGYQAVDIGHVDLEYEWFKLGVTEQIKINNKYTNEVSEGNVIGECTDKKYYEQILCRI